MKPPAPLAKQQKVTGIPVGLWMSYGHHNNNDIGIPFALPNRYVNVPIEVAPLPLIRHTSGELLRVKIA